jgi:hypothetical protein
MGIGTWMELMNYEGKLVVRFGEGWVGMEGRGGERVHGDEC